MPRQSRGVLLRSMKGGTRGRGGRAGGKAGKRALGERAREAIAEAHALAEAGKTNEAADAYASLAAIASERGKPAISAYLMCKGASAKLSGGDTDGAVATAKAGIEMAEGVAEKKRVGRFFARFIAALSEADKDAAKALRSEVKERFGLKTLPTPGEGTAPNRAQRRSLPKNCTGCGSPVDTKSIRFEDDGTADCVQCGEALG